MADLRLLVQQYETLTFQDRGFTDFWFDAGVGTGKTYIAAKWIHRQVQEQPSYALGFIGANDHDQLNMAVLPPLLNYFEEQGVAYIMHSKPPIDWGCRFPRTLAHKNILSLSTGHQFICKPMKEKRFNIPGVQIAYWWIDEIGDCPREAIQKVRERRRQPGCKHLGLVTGTPNGFDHFTYQDYMNPTTRLARHGFTKASTKEGVEAGWLKREYYDGLKAQYSRRKGLARLDGEVVDSEQLRAYESHSTENNVRDVNPFYGGQGPCPNLPIHIMCDFNPVKRCIWELGNADMRMTHVFDEVALETTRVEIMYSEVIRRYGRWSAGFRWFGDASGTRKEMTSGFAPFETLKQCCARDGIRAQFFTPKANPPIVARLEAMNASLQAYDGSVKFTYSERRCPHLHLDFLRVGTDGFKLLDNGDDDRTHGSDAVGYHEAFIHPVRGPSHLPIAGHSNTIHLT